MISLTTILRGTSSKSTDDDVSSVGDEDGYCQDEKDVEAGPLEELMSVHGNDAVARSIATVTSEVETFSLSGMRSDERHLDGPGVDPTSVAALHVRYRSIQPSDRAVIQQLHEQWFPVKYVDEFYDELCFHGRMAGSGNTLFSSLAITTNNGTSSAIDYRYTGSNVIPDECIVACVVGCFLKATILSAKTQQLLVNDVQRHPRLFYIMTVGTVARQAGLGTRMIQHCIDQVRGDVGCGVLYLHVLTDNVAAIRMYERLGFYRVQEIPSYYNIDGVLHNCYLYAMYFHGNRGHRALYNLVQSTWVSLWERVKSVSTLWSTSKCDTTLDHNRKQRDTQECADSDDGFDCVNRTTNSFETRPQGTTS